MAKRRRPEPKSNSNLITVIVVVVLLFGGAVVAGISFVVYKAVSSSSNGRNDSGSSSSFGFGSGSGSGSSSGSRPPAAASVPASELYSTLLGERTLPADQAPVDAPLRAHRNHPWVKLVKVVIEKSDGSRTPLTSWQDGERILLEFESSADFMTHPVMSHAKVMILFRTEKSQRIGMAFQSMDQLKNKGAWILADRPQEPEPFGSHRPPRMNISFLGDSAPPFTPNMELYVVLEDNYINSGEKRYKISNSLMIGNLPPPTWARDWRSDEVKQIDDAAKTKLGPSPAEREKKSADDTAAWFAKVHAEREAFGIGASATALRSATIGESGKTKFEFAQDATPVLGFAYTLGEAAISHGFDNQHAFGTQAGFDKHKGFENIRPVLKDIPVPGFTERVMAKPGYAVGGVNLEASPYISGFQVVFMRLEGKRLKTSDSYTSDWIRAGKEVAAEKASYLSEGKLVIGNFGTHSTIVHSMGLVFDPGVSENLIGGPGKPLETKDRPGAAAGKNTSETAKTAPAKEDDERSKAFDERAKAFEKRSKANQARAKAIQDRIKAIQERSKASGNRR